MNDLPNDAVEAGREAWSRLKDNSRRSFDDWIAVGRAIKVARDTSLTGSGAKSPHGKIYTKLMGDFLRQHGLDDIGQQVRYRLLEVLDNLPAILKWRESMEPAQRLRCNHPDGVMLHWRRSLRPAQAHKAALHKLGAATSRPVYWPQDCVQRAAAAIAKSRSSDSLVLARLALEGAVRNDGDLARLFSDTKPAPAPKPRPVAQAVVPDREHAGV